ncbi:endonuclease/exonuclease/phosphatase family protein [Prescottella agglutinans]|uniref:Endonuclease/exonuclease/phosphatase (EEP) superfamily protein YafD n=1 Tax=Prescottella agglutinans TaxID=1644129 RepID=A0ABT6M8S6_9NOCA|nr:endonuclease/exonuclease/phosphatase family protein [Prescottella agglutinans]MDH6280714.1 endonuclease/exonuclease/phosphatase (EEP) superfamily protein YafD [Prescottella agglutinans]
MIDRRTARTTAGAFAATCCALGAAGLAASNVNVENHFVVLLASQTPLLLVIALLGAVVAAVAERWTVEAACLAVCALGVWMLSPLYTPGAPGASPDTATGPTVRVMQANIKVGQADPSDLVRTVRDRGVDVLTVQELTDESIAGLHAAGLDDLLPHRFVVSYGPGGEGGGIYSRFPLSNTRNLEGFLSANLSADLDVGLREPLALFAVHPAPAYLFPAQMWAKELRELHSELEASAPRDNVLVSGDFNATYTQRQYRALLTDGYADAADQLGAGLLPTMPADRGIPPLIGIDRMITKGAVASSLERIPIAGSDHYGLVADIRLTNPVATQSTP